MGSAMEKVMLPVTDTACSTPTEAEELCSSAVTMAPNSTPKNGFLNAVNRFWNHSTSRNCPSTFSMLVIPMNNTPKPIIRVEISCIRLRLDTSMIAAPIATNSGAKDDGFSSEIHAPPSPEISPSRKI